MTGKLFLLLGPSGVGKGTLEKMLKEKHPEFVYPLSATTRAMRPGERDGNIYRFVSEEQFDRLIRENGLLEWAKSHGKERYGILRTDVIKALNEGKVVVREVNVDGYKSLLQSDIKDHIISVFIMPPSPDILKDRIIKRSSLPQEELERRMHNIDREISYAEKCHYKVVSIQDRQEKLYQDVEKIIMKETDKEKQVS